MLSNPFVVANAWKLKVCFCDFCVKHNENGCIGNNNWNGNIASIYIDNKNWNGNIASIYIGNKNWNGNIASI